MRRADSDPDEYRVVLIQRELGMILVHRVSGQQRLPRVKIPRRARPAQQLRQAIRSTWGVDGIVLEIILSENQLPLCAVVEQQSQAQQEDLERVTPDQVESLDLSNPERVQLASIMKGHAANPLSNPGWLDEAKVWVESACGAPILKENGIEQFNAGCGFALIRFRSETGRHYWLKATGEPNTHEPRVTQCLSRMCISHVPRSIVFHPRWNAWLMREDGIPIAKMTSNPTATKAFLEQAITAFAELQIATIGQTGELLKAKAFDQRLECLAGQGQQLFEYLDEAMARNSPGEGIRIESCRIADLRALFERLCDRVEKLGLPDAIVHGDLSLSNIVQTPDGCQFIDWCEAYVGNPLCSLQHLLLLNGVEQTAIKTSINQYLKERYQSVMSEACDPTCIGHGFVYMPFLAGVSALYGRGTWLTTTQRNQSHRQCNARAITRYLDREARDPALLDALAV